MLHGTSSPGVAGSELARLLARMADPAPPAPRPDVAERLGHWLGWTSANALSTLLGGAAPGAAAGSVGVLRASSAGDEEADFQRVRAGLLAAIAAGPDEPVSSPTDFGPYRRHCSARQHAMQDAVGALRRRLREALTRRSPALARLAALDAVLDTTLAPQERSLLGLVSLRLQAHFERLHRDASAAGEGDGGGWLPLFRADLDAVLQAELAHRLLPAQGLLDSLRAH